MEKIITAEFENIDFAEAAARNLRARINGVSQIIIQPKPSPQVSDGTLGFPFLSIEAASSASAGLWAGGNQAVPVSPVVVQGGQGPDPSLKAVLEVHVSQDSERTVPQAVNCLFNSGGVDVNIQN